MAKTLANCSIWIDYAPVDSQINQVSIEQSVAQQDVTAFANPGVARIPGLRDAVISAAGLWESLPGGAWPDPMLFQDVGSNVPITVAMARSPAAEGSVAYLMNAEIAKYGGIGAKIGNPLAFSLTAAQGGRTIGNTGNAGRLAQGVLAVNRVVSSNTASNAFQLTAPANMQSIVAALHISSVSGAAPSVFVALNSANNSGMAGFVTRWNLGTLIATGSYITEILGPITDTWWQFSFTAISIGASFTVAGSIGLAP